MKLFFLSFIVISNIVSSGCSTVQSTKGQMYPEMYNQKPVAILVIPAINHSTAADAPILYSSTINEPLSNAGFYVLPIEITDKFLRNEGFTDGVSLQNIPPQKFAEPFGADAVLYVTIETWDTNYFVFGGNVTVGTEFRLKSCKNGETLWAYKDEMVINTGGDGGGGLIAALVATAVATSVQDYVPIARNINKIALKTVPYGKYNKNFGKDRLQSVNAEKIPSN
ncbi:MAG: GNA1162 family protein [Thiohalomonadales bacterium]